MNKPNIDKETEELLDDDQLRNWFQSRDPSRKKPNPFLDEEAQENYGGGKSSSLTIKQETKEKEYGVSYSEHRRHLRQIARHFTFIGISIALIIVIFLIVLI